MRSLKQNGLYVQTPIFPILVDIRVDGKLVTLNQETMNMAIQWCKKKDTEYVKDEVFRKNFYADFCTKLGVPYTENIGMENILLIIGDEQKKKEALTKEEKKALAIERKKNREELRKIYGIAKVDGKEVEIASWTAEPSCIFMGRGGHPSRGKWKAGPKVEDITLNSSEKDIVGSWKEIVWEPNSMWIARWTDKLSGKMKYVWLADTFSAKQEKEKAKFEKALKLGEHLEELEEHIHQGMLSPDLNRRKVATAVALIYFLNMRVGDEKDKDEADTVGATTLRPEHIKIEGANVHFDFLGKDSVRWERTLTVSPQMVKNLEEFSKFPKLFEGITSADVTRFLREIVPGLTAKMFRTYRASKVMEKALSSFSDVKKEPLYRKKYYFKLANLEAAKVCNHKKALPKNYQEKLERKKERYQASIVDFEKAKWENKRIEKAKEKMEKLAMDFELTEKAGEWNLNTSLRSYINPMVVKEWLDKVSLEPRAVYSNILLRKFSWCFGEDSNHKS